MRDLLAFLPLFRPHWRSLLLGSTLTVITLLAGIGLLSLSGWFISASAIAGLSVFTRDQFNYLIPAGLVRFFSITRTGSRWAERVVTHDATFRVLSSLRVSFWQKIVPLEPSWLQNLRQSDLLNRLITDIDTLDNVYLRLLNPLVTGFIVLLCLSTAIYYFHSWQLAAALSGIWLLMLTLYPYVFYHLGKTHGENLTEAQTHLRNHLVDYVTHLDTFLLFNAQTCKLNTITQAQKKLIDSQRSLAHLSAVAQGLLVTCTGLVSTGVLALMIMQPDWMVLGPVNAFVLFATLASLEVFMPLAGAFSHTSRCQTAAARVNQILTTTASRSFGTHDTPAQSGQLHIHSLDFAYKQGHNHLLNRLDLVLKQGEKVGIVGKTGCGKSTLAKLLMRDVTPSSGTITLDGIEISHFSEQALRDSICLVSQRVDLFHDSLAKNLRMAAPHATDAELTTVLQQVQLDHIDLEETIGEGARTLSGGENRRVGIARALLRKPALVILDEPTEGLDAQTEQAIMQCCLEVFANTSILMISHRFAALSYFDYCLTLENGKLSSDSSCLSLG